MKDSFEEKRKRFDAFATSSRSVHKSEERKGFEDRVETKIESEEKDSESMGSPLVSRFSNAILITTLAMLAASFFFHALPENEIKEISNNQTTKNSKVGTVGLNSKFIQTLVAKDYTVELPKSSDGKYRIFLWNLTEKDDDEIEILVDEKPLQSSFVLTNKPTSLSISMPSTIRIRSVKDGGSGVSYAAFFPGNESTYFNVTSFGHSNAFSMKFKP
ncbi:hypothetical protein EHO60_08980 [Leptospira fletcheri]|uniref:Uncharacterized protein n=1 Tax=Leptospira fletcheri TaxID=2484981 RepID=A0A4R9GJT2_9LEPT|nr:hypothetical protein [Leptospira fletcheri]TGK12373.1 hypothetical protein EHO60_08980 [Leptospira fletcheri]